ncbi:MAG: hypothetical protein ACMUHM_03210 [Thermoplasmatota archaeon]
MNSRTIAIVFAFGVGALLLAPIVAADDGKETEWIGAELDLDIDATPDLGNLTGEIMIQFILEPSFHVDPASTTVIIDRNEDLC